MENIYIFSGVLQLLPTHEGDLAGVPPGAALYAPDVWAVMCSEYGGEAGLIADIGVTDARNFHAVV